MFKGRRALLFGQVQAESQIFSRPECMLTVNL